MDTSNEDEGSLKPEEAPQSLTSDEGSFMKALRPVRPSPIAMPQPSNPMSWVNDALCVPYPAETFLVDIELSNRPSAISNSSFKNRASFPLIEASDITKCSVDAILEQAQMGGIQLLIPFPQRMGLFEFSQSPNPSMPCLYIKEVELKYPPTFLVLKKKDIQALRGYRSIQVDEFSGGYFIENSSSVTPMAPVYFPENSSWVGWSLGNCANRAPIELTRDSIFVLAKDMIELSNINQEDNSPKDDSSLLGAKPKKQHGNSKNSQKKHEKVIEMALSYQKTNPGQCTNYSSWSRSICDHWVNLVSEHDDSELLLSKSQEMLPRTISDILSKNKLPLTPRSTK